jgi:hypothetical protein
MTKYYSGLVYCLDCHQKWAAVSYQRILLECLNCHNLSGHLLDIDVSGRQKIDLEESNKLIPFSIIQHKPVI